VGEEGIGRGVLGEAALEVDGDEVLGGGIHAREKVGILIGRGSYR
jgi:hypothetical protein